METGNTTGFNMSSNGTTDGEITLKWTTVLMGIAMYAAVLTTVCGNILVLIAVAKNRRLQTVFNFYVINLAITDLLVAVTAMGFYVTETVLGYWPFGEFLCGVWIFVDYGMTFASVFTLIVISIDRFWSVTWSLHYRAHHNKSKCIRLIIAVWVFMILLWLPPCILDRINNSVPNKCIWEPSKNKEFVVVIATIGHHGAFAVMIVCYIKVFYVLLQRQKAGLGKSRLTDKSGTETVQLRDINKEGSQDSHLAEVSGESPVMPDTSSEAPSDNEYERNRKPRVWASSLERNKTQTANENGKKMYGIHLEPICRPEVNSTVKSDISSQCSSNCISPSVTDQPSPTNESNANETLLKKQRSFINRLSRKKRKEQKEEARYERHERRVFTTLTYILAGYIICWLPFHIVFDVRAAKPEAVSPLVYNLTFWLSYLNSMINPFLYNFSSSEFRTAFKDLLCKRRPGSL